MSVRSCGVVGAAGRFVCHYSYSYYALPNVLETKSDPPHRGFQKRRKDDLAVDIAVSLLGRCAGRPGVLKHTPRLSFLPFRLQGFPRVLLLEPRRNPRSRPPNP